MELIESFINYCCLWTTISQSLFKHLGLQDELSRCTPRNGLFFGKIKLQKSPRGLKYERIAHWHCHQWLVFVEGWKNHQLETELGECPKMMLAFLLIWASETHTIRTWWLFSNKFGVFTSHTHSCYPAGPCTGFHKLTLMTLSVRNQPVQQTMINAHATNYDTALRTGSGNRIQRSAHRLIRCPSPLLGEYPVPSLEIYTFCNGNWAPFFLVNLLEFDHT